jgi:hypothetical protein
MMPKHCRLNASKLASRLHRLYNVSRHNNAIPKYNERKQYYSKRLSKHARAKQTRWINVCHGLEVFGDYTDTLPILAGISSI